MATKFVPYAMGNLQEWASSSYPDTFTSYEIAPDGRGTSVVGEWRANEPFPATMVYDGWGRGRSAVRIYWKDGEGNRYPMFMKDFDVILSQGLMAPFGGETRILGTWMVMKRGANYGIALVESE